MASDIQVSTLTATPAVGQIGIVAIALPPAGMECLSYMQPAKVEIFAATTNNRNNAVKVGETTSGFFVHGNLGASVNRWYWARAVDGDGNLGAFYPAATNGGVVGSTLTTKPGPDSIGTEELIDGSVISDKIANLAIINAKIANLAVNAAKIADAAITNAKIANLAVDAAKIANLAVVDAKIANMSASKLTAGTVAVTISLTSPIINSGTITGSLLRTAATGARVMVRGSDNDIVVYNSSNSIICAIGDLSGAAGGPTGLFSGYSSYPALSVANLSSGYSIDAWRGKVRAVDGYLPFTGMHQMLVRKDAKLDEGDLAASVSILARDRWSNVLAEVERSSTVGDRRIVGVVSERRAMLASDWLPGLGTRPRETREVERVPPVRRRIMERYDLVTLNALGEGQMLVCGRGGDIEAGDYVCSSDLAGKGQRQNDAAGAADDLLRRCTVAQTMEPVAFDHPDQVKRVAVFYRCG